MRIFGCADDNGEDMLSLSIDCDFDIGDIVYYVRSYVCGDRCLCCVMGQGNSAVEQSQVRDVYIRGTGPFKGTGVFCNMVSMTDQIRFEVQLDNGWFIEAKKLFATREEAESNLDNENVFEHHGW